MADSIPKKPPRGTDPGQLGDSGASIPPPKPSQDQQIEKGATANTSGVPEPKASQLQHIELDIPLIIKGEARLAEPQSDSSAPQE